MGAAMRKLVLAALLLGVSCTALAQIPGAQAPDFIALCYHDVRDHVGGTPTTEKGSLAIVSGSHELDPDQYAISTRNLASQFDWLRSHGYHVVSLQQVIDARSGGATLPDQAVLLTFDDGLRSAYTKVFPLLKAYHYPAVMAVVGAWASLPADGKVDYGFRNFTRDDFATWDELREMQQSGLVEIASHTWELHEGIDANPQGNVIPAVIVHAYDAKTGHYETDEEYAARIRVDLARNSREIEEHVGHAPRAVMWPYGAYTQVADSIAESLGMQVSFTLGWPVTFPDRTYGLKGLHAIPRLVMMSNPTLADFLWSFDHLYMRSNIRAVQVDLDYIYDPDPTQQEKNLGELLDRIQKLNVTHVWLQAYADPDGSGTASAVYFPNHELPMRADLFSRVAWQLRTRCGVEVYAWMPVLAWRLPDASQQARLQIAPKAGEKDEPPVRLNPFLPETQKLVGDLYEDMGRAAPVAGILFSDDAVLRDSDDLGTAAPAAGPERTKALIDFTLQMAAHTRHWSPELATARNLFAEPVLHPEAEAWFAQSLPAFLASYNVTALMAMPSMENAAKADPWLTQLARAVEATPGGTEQTIFELQTVDWRTNQAIPTSRVAKQMRELQDVGILHLGYYPDDFAKDNPDIDRLSPSFSAATFAPQQH
jgi:poly-beta-1,6-N-acetyl-D-glucosamine N-deacetylase